MYTLHVKIPDQSPIRMEVKDQILAGIDPRNDLILIDPAVKAKHFLFKRKENALTVHYLGTNGNTFLNGQYLEKDKLYILDNADVLKVGRVEIIIGNDKGLPLPTSPEAFPFKEMSIKKIKEEASKEERTFTFNTIRLIPYKVYGFVVDMALTYLFLSFVIPTEGFLSLTQDLISPLSAFIFRSLTFHQHFIASMRILSLIEFFICFHLLMVVTSLVLGTTPGAFLIGLHEKSPNKNFLAIRFKAYLYALLNIIVLPLLLFDIPLYRGKNLKELLTFSTRDLSASVIFKISRRAITPILTMACFFSPFFLGPPYTANITPEKNFPPKYKDVHAISLSSASKELGLSLNSELSNQYALLPYFENKKIGLVLYDLKNDKALLMQEQNRLSLSEALFRLRYANAFSSLSVPDYFIGHELLKNKSLKSLTLSLTTLIPGLLEFGPMLANGFLFKESFLKNFRSQDNFLLNSFDKKNPVIKISTNNEEKVFLFAKKEIIEFSLIGPKLSALLDNFTSGVLAGLSFNQTANDKLRTPQILEALEAFEHSDDHTLLTYYINEAKKINNLNNPKWRAFLKKNILQTKQALLEDKMRINSNKNIEKSFNDIINTL